MEFHEPFLDEFINLIGLLLVPLQEHGNMLNTPNRLSTRSCNIPQSLASSEIIIEKPVHFISKHVCVDQTINWSLTDLVQVENRTVSIISSWV